MAIWNSNGLSTFGNSSLSLSAQWLQFTAGTAPGKCSRKPHLTVTIPAPPAITILTTPRRASFGPGPCLEMWARLSGTFGQRLPLFKIPLNFSLRCRHQRHANTICFEQRRFQSEPMYAEGSRPPLSSRQTACTGRHSFLASLPLAGELRRRWKKPACRRAEAQELD